jgi:hypothetical protein
MKNGFEGIRAWAISRIPKAKVRWVFVAALVPILLLRSYFVRVLLTSELFLAFAFAAVSAIGAAAYLMGVIAASWIERSRQNVETD